MKASFVVGAFAGYVLGARAGRQRYEQIVAVARRVAGSQTIQSTAGVVQAQAGELTTRAKDKIVARIPLINTLSGGTARSRPASTLNGVNGVNGVNGHR